MPLDPDLGERDSDFKALSASEQPQGLVSGFQANSALVAVPYVLQFINIKY